MFVILNASKPFTVKLLNIGQVPLVKYIYIALGAGCKANIFQMTTHRVAAMALIDFRQHAYIFWVNNIHIVALITFNRWPFCKYSLLFMY